jgi:hypothetical protein
MKKNVHQGVIAQLAGKSAPSVATPIIAAPKTRRNYLITISGYEKTLEIRRRASQLYKDDRQ